MNSEQNTSSTNSTNSTKPIKPNLESIINEVSASEDFQNLLKSVSKNIGSIVENSRNKNFPSDSGDKPEVIPATGQEANQTPETKSSNPPNPPPSTSKEIRTVPLEPSTSVEEEEDNIHDTIMTLLSDEEGNTLGEIASSIEHHLEKIASSLEKLVDNKSSTVLHTKTIDKTNEPNELSVD